MGFADAYLLKAGLREALVEAEPHSGLLLSVIIPVYNESGLERCLDSLFQCSWGPKSGSAGINSGSTGTGSEGAPDVPAPDLHAEVLILINAPAEAPREILEKNLETLDATRDWIESHPHPCMDFHVWLDHSFGKKEAGVGTARKILMDEAVRRFSLLNRPGGIIASMDADAWVEPSYLEALVKHFRNGDPGVKSGSNPGPDGCSIRYEHPISGDEFSPAVYHAIIQYELHLRYYVQSVRSTGYPHAFHTVGSAFAVRAGIYCMEGGMNRRQGGEDFYFIQKVAGRGHFSQCNSTCVHPSPRPSDRVPFGTGPVVARLSKDEGPLITYDPRPFVLLKQLFMRMYRDASPAASHGSHGPNASPAASHGSHGPYASPAASHESHGPNASPAAAWPEPLQSFLVTQDFHGALEEIDRNSASPAAFRKRFWRWFSMFRIMKFLHYARERGYPDVPVTEAAAALLRTMDPEGTGIPSIGTDPEKLLLIYRMLDMQ